LRLEFLAAECVSPPRDTCRRLGQQGPAHSSRAAGGHTNQLGLIGYLGERGWSSAEGERGANSSLHWITHYRPSNLLLVSVVQPRADKTAASQLPPGLSGRAKFSK